MNKIFNVNQSFGSKHLYTAKLKEKNPATPAEINKDIFISELENSDQERLSLDINNWEDTIYGEKIINNFLDECRKGPHLKFLLNKFFIIEDIKNEIKGLAHAKINNNVIDLEYLQSESEKKKEYAAKGVGSCLLYAISKLAQNKKKNSVYIKSIPQSVQFYYKAGIETSGKTIFDFVIKQENFAKFQENIEKKYSITSVEI